MTMNTKITLVELARLMAEATSTKIRVCELFLREPRLLSLGFDEYANSIFHKLIIYLFGYKNNAI